jgi:hypothetical protein
MRALAKLAAAEMDELNARISAALEGKTHESDLAEMNAIAQELHIEGQVVQQRQAFWAARMQAFLANCDCPACRAGRADRAPEEGERVRVN